MSKHQKAVAAACLGTVLLLSACGVGVDPAKTKPADPTAVQQKPSEPYTGKIGSLTGLEVQTQLVLPPGGSAQLTVNGLQKGESKKNITGSDELSYRSDRPDVVTVGPSGQIQIAANAKTGQTGTVTVTYKDLSAQCTVKVKKTLQDTITVNAKGIPVVTNPADTAVLVNKKRSLPDNWEPDDLVEPKIPFSFKEKLEKRLLRKEAAEALERLFAQAEKDGMKLYGVSGYRSYATQKSIFNNNVKTQGEKEASQLSAQPGQSEHQTGLAIDVSSPSAKFALEETFGTTAEGKWLAKHAHEFGFIIRYPKGKEEITGYAYEPWHIRYVGKEIAKEIAERGITLEEYFQDAVPVSN